MIVLTPKKGLMKCAVNGMGDSLSVFGRPWSCFSARGQRLQYGQRMREALFCANYIRL